MAQKHDYFFENEVTELVGDTVYTKIERFSLEDFVSTYDITGTDDEKKKKYNQYKQKVSKANSARRQVAKNPVKSRKGWIDRKQLQRDMPRRLDLVKQLKEAELQEQAQFDHKYEERELDEKALRKAIDGDYKRLERRR